MSAFGKDIWNFDIEDSLDGKVYTMKATSNNEYREPAGYIKVAGNVIIKFAITDKYNPSYELLKALCAKFDEENQPLMVDENTVSLQMYRMLEGFGFRSGEDSIMTRLPYAVIPADYNQAKSPPGM